MSGTASVPNTFASAVTATGQQLDSNFSTLVAYINNPTNRNNYAVDTGGTNTIALSFSPAVAGFTGGLELTFKAANTNSGGVVLIPNSIGTRTVVNSDGSALSAGQITAGMVYKTIDDGTRAVFIGPSIPATQAQVVAATVGGVFITPAVAKYHPGVAKASAWWNGTATGTITGSEREISGFTAISRAGVGTWSFALSAPFATTRYVVLADASATAGLAITREIAASRTTAGFVITAFNAASTAVDITWGNLAVYGTLP